MIIQLKHNNKKTLIFFKSIFDTMIPEDKIGKLPKLSKSINVKDLLKTIFSNKDLKIKLREKLDLILSSYKKTNNFKYSDLGKKIVETKEIESLIEHYVLEAYFTSNFVKKKLLNKSNIAIYKNIKRRDDISSLLKKNKKNKIRYKKI